MSLRSDSCLCNACYRDCVRGTGKPRWLALSKHLVCRHCVLCCNGPLVCTCDSILEWGPEQWYGTTDELKLWLEHYQCSTVVHVDSQQNYNLCKSHYVSMRQVASNRSYQICSCTSPSQWYNGQTYLDKIGSQTCEHNIDPLGWLCGECFKLRAVRQGKYQEIRDEVLENTLKVLVDKGACMMQLMYIKLKFLINISVPSVTMNVKVIGKS